MSTTSIAQPILVKRYGQDRLYDPARGCYVSVEQLRGWSRQGIALSVIDTETGADVTRVVLRDRADNG
jgi:polyhydroxyalkanoate synthesis regulator protein